jgi:hypothetical protein
MPAKLKALLIKMFPILRRLPDEVHDAIYAKIQKGD